VPLASVASLAMMALFWFEQTDGLLCKTCIDIGVALGFPYILI
jgi:hypothetical protein